jgi:hypothetical protein
VSIAIKDLVVGKTYWESGSDGNIEFEVLAPPVLIRPEDDFWQCIVRSYYRPYTISESKGYKLGIYDKPAYTGVLTEYLDGRIE